MRNSDAAIIRGLRRARYEPQLTQALAGLFTAEPRVAAAFVRLLLAHPDLKRPVDVSDLPAEFACAPEERFSGGRLDLRFRAPDWDVIVELKIDAGYGLDQIDRYVGALGQARHSHLVALTRTVPLYGEETTSPAWRGSILWRRVLAGLSALPIQNQSLAHQWSALLHVLEEEGSMGFTKPDPDLFATYARIRAAAEHTDAFLDVLSQPLLAALRDALGNGEAGADFRSVSRGKPALSRSRVGSAEYQFVVPRGGVTRVSAGLFGWQPPTRFSIAPAGAKRLLESTAPNDSAVCRQLIASGFRAPSGNQADLRAFRPLEDDLLLSDDLEATVVEWAHGQFAAMRESGFFSLRGEPGDAPSADDGQDDPAL